MVTLYNDNVLRDGEKIGYYENNRFFDMGGREVGYHEDGHICDENGHMKGYLENGKVYWADGSEYDEIEKVRQHVSSGNYSEMSCAAVAILFGWD